MYCCGARLILPASPPRSTPGSTVDRIDGHVCGRPEMADRVTEAELRIPFFEEDWLSRRKKETAASEIWGCQSQGSLAGGNLRPFPYMG